MTGPAIPLRTGSQSFAVPLPPNLANGRQHWAAKHRDKRRYWDYLNQHLAFRIIPSPPLKWPAFAKVTMTMFVFNRLDRDNLYARAKWPLDWLVGHGYIAGDRESQIDLVVQQKVDRKNPRLLIEILPVEAPTQ